jgi:AraC family transcriptional regulator, melibiose operon regulatory protein
MNAMSHKRVAPFEEQQVAGSDIDLPFITALCAARANCASHIPWHAHKSHEMLFILDGATAYEFQDRPRVKLSGGDFLVVPAGMVHRGAQEVRMPSVICGVSLQPLLRNASRNSVFTNADMRQIDRQIRDSALGIRQLKRDLRQNVVRLFEQIEEFAAGRRDDVVKARLRALSCIVVLETAHQLTLPIGVGKPAELVAAAEAYLRRRFADPIQMPDLVHHIGLSRARMFELFKSVTGLTPNDYLLRYRIEQARELLTSTQRGITDIAMATGFSSSQYFSNVFRKYTGLTPSEYRRHR